MAGYVLDKPTLDAALGSAVVNVRLALNAAGALAALLNDANILSDATLTAKGYSTEEIATIRAAFAALDNLRKIADAQATQSAPNDFFWDAKKLAGVNYTRF